MLSLQLDLVYAEEAGCQTEEEVKLTDRGTKERFIAALKHKSEIHHINNHAKILQWLAESVRANELDTEQLESMWGEVAANAGIECSTDMDISLKGSLLASHLEKESQKFSR